MNALMKFASIIQHVAPRSSRKVNVCYQPKERDKQLLKIVVIGLIETDREVSYCSENDASSCLFFWGSKYDNMIKFTRWSLRGIWKGR